MKERSEGKKEEHVVVLDGHVAVFDWHATAFDRHVVVFDGQVVVFDWHADGLPLMEREKRRRSMWLPVMAGDWSLTGMR